MAKSDRINVANGVVSVIVLICGITLSILTQRIVTQFYDVLASRYGYLYNTRVPIWIIGFIYIIPGFFGALASWFHKRGLFITQLVLSIISLVAIIFSMSYGLGSPTVRAVFDSKTCEMIGGSCVCSTGYLRSLSRLGFSCDEIASLTGLGVGTDVMTVLGAILTLIGTFLAGKYVCCSQQSEQNRETVNNTHQMSYMGGNPQRVYTAQPGFVTHPGYEAFTGYSNPAYNNHTGYSNLSYTAASGHVIQSPANWAGTVQEAKL